MISKLSSGVDTWINYYLPPEKGATPGINDMGVVLGNKDMITHRMHVNDIRGHEDEFNLKDNGFEYARLSTKCTDWESETEIKAIYYPEIEELLKKTTGASRVLVYHHAVRTKSQNVIGKQGFQGQEGPAFRIHVDQTPDGANGIVDFIYPEQSAEIKSKGYQLLNVWRPLHRVRRDPLMVADMGKMSRSDLVPVIREYPNGMKASNYVVKYDGSNATKEDQQDIENPDVVADGYSSGGEHSWWYIGGQEADEGLVFLSADLKAGRKESGTVHGAFCLPEQDGIPPRQSIEVRAVAVFE